METERGFGGESARLLGAASGLGGHPGLNRSPCRPCVGMPPEGDRDAAKDSQSLRA